MSDRDPKKNKNLRKKFEKVKYSVREPVFSAASSSSVVLSSFWVQRLTIRSYTYWDGNLILA